MNEAMKQAILMRLAQLEAQNTGQTGYVGPNTEDTAQITSSTPPSRNLASIAAERGGYSDIPLKDNKGLGRRDRVPIYAGEEDYIDTSESPTVSGPGVNNKPWKIFQRRTIYR